MTSLIGHVSYAFPTDHVSYELPEMTFDSAASICISKIKLTIHYTYFPIIIVLVNKYIIHP